MPLLIAHDNIIAAAGSLVGAEHAILDLNPESELNCNFVILKQDWQGRMLFLVWSLVH